MVAIVKSAVFPPFLSLWSATSLKLLPSAILFSCPPREWTLEPSLRNFPTRPRTTAQESFLVLTCAHRSGGTTQIFNIIVLVVTLFTRGYPQHSIIFTALNLSVFFFHFSNARQDPMFPWARVQNGVLPRPNATLQATHAHKIPFIMFTYFYVLAFLFCLLGGSFIITVEPRKLELWRETINSSSYGGSSYRGRLQIQFSKLKIDSYWFFSTSVYGAV